MTSSSVPLTGSIVALVTPMHEDGSVDYPTLRKLIDWHIAEGTDCIGVVYGRHHAFSSDIIYLYRRFILLGVATCG
eukprot:gene44243-59914_t